jgi:hypothetical protein
MPIGKLAAQARRERGLLPPPSSRRANASRVQPPALCVPVKGSRRQSGSIQCPICADVTPDKVADHCHETGAVREWICRRCNVGLGMFRDNPAAMEAAAAYIRKHQANPTDGLAFLRGEVGKLSRRQFERRAADWLA